MAVHVSVILHVTTAHSQNINLFLVVNNSSKVSVKSGSNAFIWLILHHITLFYFSENLISWINSVTELSK